LTLPDKVVRTRPLPLLRAQKSRPGSNAKIAVLEWLRSRLEAFEFNSAQCPRRIIASGK